MNEKVYFPFLFAVKYAQVILDRAILQDKIPFCWMYMLQIRSGTSGRAGHSSHKLWPNSSANKVCHLE